MSSTVNKKTALIVIDVQNDYFAGGKYPQWEADKTLETIENSIISAREKGWPVYFIKHIGTTESPFFVPDSEGIAIHPRALDAAPKAKVITKKHADAFLNTELELTLKSDGIENLLICGMMTQNCVAFTAMSKMADQYTVTVIGDACTSVDRMVHGIALRAIADHVEVKAFHECF
ncbi:cysteine hydrolase family protein [Marinomonas balearica]|uniref:Nicotinamidase-related amidase n=1 Tax=Marinomonas balearica TaxID=491947 RepID=A0A4R6MLH4_9GAMM|nr:cysteine hydrolase family protein [Marinomonas balearica]TDP01861.1 nicotinamidase-related amidase [Marinomonas balearica]